MQTGQTGVANGSYGWPGMPPSVWQMPPSVPGMTSLRIVYNNDPHEKYKAMPHLATGFRYFSQEGETLGRDVLRLNGGDNNVGKEGHEWKLSVLLMNLLNYHAVVMGNHELDQGSRNYAEGLQYATFPTVVSNLNILPGSAMGQRIRQGKLHTGPMIIQGQQGRYGVIGVTTPDLDMVLSKSARLEGESAQPWERTVANVQAQVAQLKAQGINKIVVLSHLGFDLDKQLAKTVGGIDVILGGHSHDLLKGISPGINYLNSPEGEPVLIIQAGKNARWMGVADLLFDAKGRVIPQQNAMINPFNLPPDPQAIVIRDAVLGKPKPLAILTVGYDGSENAFKPDAVAQFTADAMRAYSGADIAFVRSPEVRNNFDPGVFTDHDLKALMPFVDPIVKITVTGDELLKALERSAQGLAEHESHPGMLHPSGLNVTMNKRTGHVTQASVYNRMTRHWEPLNPYKTYTMAIGEFTVQNQEFPEFAHPQRIFWNGQRPLRWFFAWGLKQAGAPQHPVAFQDDGRLQIV